MHAAAMPFSQQVSFGAEREGDTAEIVGFWEKFVGFLSDMLPFPQSKGRGFSQIFVGNLMEVVGNASWTTSSGASGRGVLLHGRAS